MKVLLTANRDWANHGYIMSRCLQLVGVDATMICKHPTRFNYGTIGKIVKNSETWNNYIDEADIIIIMHTQFIGTNVDLSKKKVLVFHTGTKYHNSPNSMNKKFNFVDASLVAANIFGLGAKNEKYVPVAVDTNKFQPDYETGDKLFVGHYPTIQSKGGELIKEVLSSMLDKFEFKTDFDKLPWDKHIERVKKCDIYIEDIGTHDKKGNLKKGGLGLTALEAASLGKIVITRMNLSYIKKYEKELGKCNVQVIDKPNELKEKLLYLLSLSKEEIIGLKKQSREWVERIHSYKAVGSIFKQIFEEL